ncbi:hypothetical protein [Dyadobacter crusticola]|uniref:hypothetical protein n=1 Tax=Dyadobacter crusticola TaxID=292407 RepID=UPI0004E2600E|nr:hypothetical protein [Dyadobacter crusticola]
MGMFDTLLFDINLLPVSDEEKQLLLNEEFQTKSLDNLLRTYRITEKGNLLYGVYSSDFLDDYAPACQYEKWIEVPEVHGYISFYTSLTDSNRWYEFVAKFTNGKLVEVFRNEGTRYEGNRKMTDVGIS